MIADFIITIHSDPPRKVQVKVHESVATLRSAATRYDRTGKANKDMDHSSTLGVCHRFVVEHPTTDNSIEQDGLVAIVRLAPPNIGVGVISHEMAHAAVWIHELDTDFKVSLVCENDEQFCWNLGELVRQTVNKLIEKGLYDE